jgi:hypothetical protein
MEAAPTAVTDEHGFSVICNNRKVIRQALHVSE